MMRVSPPELAREFPGPHASNNVTFAPFLSSSSAVQPPNAPAPTTMTELREELPNARRPIRYTPTQRTLSEGSPRSSPFEPRKILTSRDFAFSGPGGIALRVSILFLDAPFSRRSTH